ncbi:hypothetical protein JCM8547_002772 [Rhodosporidiobolus lusitaniae]
MAPPLPPNPPSDSHPSSLRPPPRRQPSRRVSDLVAKFETPSSSSSSTSPIPSSSSHPLSSAAAAALRAALGPGQPEASTSQVQRHVRRFLAGPGLTSTASAARSTRKSGEVERAVPAPSPAVLTGSISGMDWTPRRQEPASSPTEANRNALPDLPSASEKKSKPSLALPAAKTGAAATVVVPAAVSSGKQGETSMKMGGTASSSKSSPASDPLSVERTRARSEQPRREQKAAQVGPSLPPPPRPSSSPAPAIVETRRPSIAFADAPPPRRNDNRSASAPAPSDDLLKPPRPPLLHARSSPSSPLADPSKPPIRPRLTRGSTTDRSSYTTFTRSSFSVPPTPSSGCTSTATRSVPAYKVFARHAEPLVLPELDRVLVELGGLAHFTPMPGVEDGGMRRREKGKRRSLEDEEFELDAMKKGEKEEDGEEKVFGGSGERERWDAWVQGKPPGFWSRLRARFSQVDPMIKQQEERQKRSLVFPPFHLQPSLTLPDLKLNRHKPPPLLSFQSVVQKAANGLIGAASSSAGIRLTTVEGLRDVMQMITLLITAASPTLSSLTAGSTSTSSTASTELAATHSSLLRTFFVTIPSFLSLDFVAAFGQALILLFILSAVTLLALYEFYRFTGGWHGPSGALGRGKLDLGEGFDREDLHERKKSWRDSRLYLTAVTFWCTSLYLPLSRMSIGALLWTSDYWTVSNPYELFNSDNPSPPSLGPSSEYYDSMDFCYRTSMKKGDANLAFLLIPVAVVIILILSLWFPIRLWSVIQRERPRIDGWTELGERRRDVDGEYQRLLDADPSPFNFLYREYRYRWAAFRSIFLAVKLVNVLLVVLVDKNNCALRSFTTSYLDLVRQGSLLAFMGCYFGLSAWSSPFLDLPSNSSDLVSRVGYTLLAMLGLLAALGVPETDGGIVAVNVILYSFNVYFALIGVGFAQKLVKRAQKRLDFSIDIFSPRIDLAKHMSRRVWQETMAALLLCSPAFAMTPGKQVVFTREEGQPPYLLDFDGSVGARFVENLKILREIGLDAYHDAVDFRQFSPKSRLMTLRREIQLNLTGPDAFYHPPDLALPVTSYFGRIDVVPFPFVVVFRYDQQPTNPLLLTDIEDLARLVEQNQSPAVAAKRKVRLAVRSLDDALVFAPHVQVRNLGSSGQVDIERLVSFTSAVVRIKRNSSFLWRGYNFSSGFEVTLEYTDGEGADRDGRRQKKQHLVLEGPEFGLHDDFELTQPLATLFRHNRAIIERRLPEVEQQLQQHRAFFRDEANAKQTTLSHAFLLDVFAEDSLSVEELEYRLKATERNSKVRKMVSSHRDVFLRLEERMDAIKSSDLRGWWYLCWDDLWRRNHNILHDKPEHFSPHYRTSICYNPMPRARLEEFLHERGLATKGSQAYFHVGFLNQIYFYLDERIFGNSAIPIHLGSSPERVPFLDLPHALSHQHLLPPPPAQPGERNISGGTLLSRYTVDTGGGTAEDDPAIRQRPAFLFEEALERPRPPFKTGHRLEWTRFAVARATGVAKTWLALSPLVSDWRPTEEEGINLDLRRGRAGWEMPHRARREKGVNKEEEWVEEVDERKSST